MRRSGAAPSDMQRNESFLSDLGERLRRLDDPVAILGEAAASLGAHLGVNRAGYAEFDADARHFTVERDWTDGSVKHGTGRRATLSFGADVVAMLYRGETQCIVDAYVDPRVRPADLAAFVEMSIVAAVTVPLVKSGRLVAMLSVHQSRPRAWTAAEVALVEQVAERTWAALERARAEARAQDSQAQLRLLADNMAQLAWIAGADGAPHWYNRRWYDYSGATSDRMADEGWAGFVAPEARDDAQAQVARALETGDAFELVLPLRAADGRHRPFLVRVQPERGRDGGVLRWFGTGTDIADRMESERASAFLLALGDRTRRSTDPADVLSASIAALGRHLGASRVGYAEVEADGETIEVVHDWTDGSVASVAGRHLLRAFGEAHGAIVRAGETFRADDVAARIAAGDRAVFDAMRIAAAVTVPLVKQDRLVAVLSVHQREPRTWTEAEVQLIREVAERTWAALEWARAEAALRDTQRNQAFLLTLGDRVRGEADPTVVIAATNRALGEHLGALRVGYGEVDDTGERLTFTADWTDGVISNVGTFELAAFGEAIVAANRAGRTFATDDVAADPRIGPDHVAAFTAWGVNAIVAVPLVKAGRFTAVLSVQSSAPRAWTRAELSLIEEVAERTWTTLERARVEAELRRSQALLAAFLENAPVGMYLKDEDGRYLMANAGMERIFGRPVAEAVGRTPAELFDADLQASIAAQDALALAEGRAQQTEQHLPGRQDDSWTLVIRFPIDLGDQGRRIGGFAIDVTELKLAEARLAESEARLMAFLTHAPASMYLKDEEGRYLIANADVARRLGVAPDRILGRRLSELAATEIAAHAEACEREVLATGRIQTGEQAFELAHGMVHAMATRFPVPDAEGRPTRVGGVLIDITAQKRAEAELERSREALYQSEKLTALGSLLAGVSHELNNPLSIVVGQSMILEDEAEGTSTASRAVKIRKAAERCAKIVQTFLAMARQKPPSRAPVDANAVVGAALDLTDYALRTAGVAVTSSLAPDLPSIDADADQLHQVLANLLINAQQALQEVVHARRLTIVTRRGRTDGTVEIEVADNGPGVPRDARRRVFEPFYTTKPQGVGTGLGLSFSLGVVEAHGGRLELLDADQGAAFLLTLPAGMPTDAGADAAATGTQAASGTALVVDDEPEIAEMLAEILTRDGYRVHVASSGAEAMARLRERDFDLVLSDLRMPDIDGPALHAWIGQQRPSLLRRIGFVTGDTMGPAAVRFLAHAGCHYLEKPFTPAAVRDLVRRLRAPIDQGEV